MRIVSDISRISQLPVSLELLRGTPNPKTPSDKDAQTALLSAFRQQQTDRGMPKYGIRVEENTPENLSRGETIEKILNKQIASAQYASATPFATKAPTGGVVKINPNTDRAFFAHELGHHSAAQKGLGKKINDMRQIISRSPALKKALTQATHLGPLAASALIPGSGDLLTALAIGLAPSAVTLTNEAQASLQGLDILKRADMKATAGQRARLAGAFMSYATPALLYSLGGNALGNLADDTIAREIYGIDPNDV